VATVAGVRPVDVVAAVSRWFVVAPEVELEVAARRRFLGSRGEREGQRRHGKKRRAAAAALL
jgi:hypothetical protein